jgi:hypothetical protein
MGRAGKGGGESWGIKSTYVGGGDNQVVLYLCEGVIVCMQYTV